MSSTRRLLTFSFISLVDHPTTFLFSHLSSNCFLVVINKLRGHKLRHPLHSITLQDISFCFLLLQLFFNSAIILPLLPPLIVSISVQNISFFDTVLNLWIISILPSSRLHCLLEEWTSVPDDFFPTVSSSFRILVAVSLVTSPLICLSWFSFSSSFSSSSSSLLFSALLLHDSFPPL